MNKHEFQIGELDKHKLKVIVLHNDIGKEVHMTRLVNSLLQIQFQLLELGGSRLDELRIAWSPGQ